MIFNMGGGGFEEKVTVDGEKVKTELSLTTYSGNNPLVVGTDELTIEKNTLIDEDVQIVSGVTGEDLTETANAQTDAVEDLMIMVRRKMAQNNGEGACVWKKLTAEGGDFIDYVVSGDTGAFPDGGTVNGYWYELVEEKPEWEEFTASYSFPDGGLYETKTADITTPTLFSIGTHEIYITEVTCGPLGGSKNGTFDPMKKYFYEDGWESFKDLDTPLFMSLACGIRESSIGDAYIDSAYNEHSVNHLSWAINGSNVALTRVDSCASYDTTAWGISSVAIKGYRRKL